MTEQDNYQGNVDTTSQKKPTSEDSEGDGTSFPEIWDRAGKFKDAKESAIKFLEFMENLVNKSDQSAERAVRTIVLLGESFASRGRSGEALVSCEYLGELYSREEFARFHESLAKGIVSIGSKLLDQDLRADAIKVFNGVESLLRDAEQAALRPLLAQAISERGFALKEEAWASGDESLMADAISAFTELERKFGQDRDELFEEIVALGTYNKAGALGALGQLDEATACFRQVISQYRNSAGAAVREVAMFATIRERMMLAVPDPPPYIAVPLPDTEINWLIEGVDADNFETVASWLTEEDPEKQLAMYQAVAVAASKSHFRARQILMQYRLKAFPFALLLRSFDEEGSTSTTGPKWPAETGLAPQAMITLDAEPTRLEREIAKATDSYNSALTIANRNSLLESAWVVPRLFLPDDGWRAIVEDLIRAAHIIAIGIEEMTPGIRWELECIKRCDRTDSAVVVLTADDHAWIRGSFREAGGLEEKPPFATKESAELAGFERVIAADEIPVEGLASAPPLRDLLQDMEAIARLDPEGRVRYQARRLSSPPDP